MGNGFSTQNRKSQNSKYGILARFYNSSKKKLTIKAHFTRFLDINACLEFENLIESNEQSDLIDISKKKCCQDTKRAKVGDKITKNGAKTKIGQKAMKIKKVKNLIGSFSQNPKKKTLRSLKIHVFLMCCLLGKVSNEKEWDYEAHWI